MRSALVLVLVVGCGAVPSRSLPPEAPREGDAALADALAPVRARHALPGVSALRIEDAVSEHATLGFRSLPDRVPLRRADRFHLGSDGKAMTATLVAVLIEAGLLPGWDAPLSAVFAGETIDAGWMGVTLAELASHRAGLPRDPEEVSDEERARILAIVDPVEQRRVLMVRELARRAAASCTRTSASCCSARRSSVPRARRSRR